MKQILRSLRADRNMFVLVLPAALSIAAMCRYYNAIYYPTLDTGWYYQVFAYALADLRDTGQFPMWVPESNYGMPAYFLLGALGPSQYLFLLAGLLLKFSALNLFLMSLALDQFIFLFGIALLSRRLFYTAPEIVAYCVVSCALVTVLDNQMGFNFKIFQTLPLSFYLVLIGIERARAAPLFCAATLLLAFEFGNILYVLPFQLYCLVIFGIFLWVTSEDRVKRLFATLRSIREPANAVILAGAICLAGILFYLALRLKSEMIPADASRGSDLSVSLETYLSYGGFTGAQKLLEFVTGQTIHPRSEFMGFFGVTGLVLLIYAVVVAERSRIFYGFFVVLLFVILFTVRETGVARIVYYLPGMDHFRHIAYMLSSAKWLAIICAGFGFFHFTTTKISSRDALFFLIAAGIVSVAFLFAGFVPLNLGPGLSVSTYLRSGIFIFLTGAAGLFMWFTSAKLRTLPLIGIAILELVLYRSLLPFPTHVDPSARTDYANVAVRTYQPERIWADELSSAIRFQQLTGLAFVHDMENAFLGVDLCGGSRSSILARSIVVTKDVEAFLTTWNSSHASAATLLSALGCHTPKLRLVRNSIVVTSDVAAKADMQRGVDFYQTPIVISSQTADGSLADLAATTRPEAAANSAPADIWSNPITDLSQMGVNSTTGVQSGEASAVIDVEQYQASLVRMSVKNPYQDDAWLIYSDLYHPAWSSLLDGRPEHIARANLAFKAVRIPPGRHEVIFSFSRGLVDYLYFGLAAVLIFIVPFICIFAAREDTYFNIVSPVPM